MFTVPRSRMLALLLMLGYALALFGCAADDPKPIASNCDDPEGCSATPQPLERIDAVDILLVLDNSGSIAQEAGSLIKQLPRMLNAIVNGGEGDTSFPPAASVHIAVATSDMGLASENSDPTEDSELGSPGEMVMNCGGLGDDGIFVRPADAELSCEKSYPGYLAFDGGPAAVATVDTVECVPLLGMDGCGFEQPLEASLKALWPASNTELTFRGGNGHGAAENAGFLRDDSLLVIIVVTDEDDCSTDDPLVTPPEFALDPTDPEQAALMMQGMNTRCALNPERLFNTERYVAGLKALHADHPDRVIFATIAGIPPELVSSDAAAIDEIEDDAERDLAYAAILDNRFMQPTVETQGTEETDDDGLRPSCNTEYGLAYPPVRLVQTARAFGAQGVLGSICAKFGDTTGTLIRTIGQRLTAAANGTAADAGTGE